MQKETDLAAARKHKKRKLKPTTPASAKQAKTVAPEENRAAESLTVFWMLTLMATLAAELASLIGWGLLLLVDDPTTLPQGVAALPGLLLLIALVTGVLCLLLTPLAYRIRRVPPPLGVAVIAAVVGASPLIALLLLQLVG